MSRVPQLVSAGLGFKSRSDSKVLALKHLEFSWGAGEEGGDRPSIVFLASVPILWVLEVWVLTMVFHCV